MKKKRKSPGAASAEALRRKLRNTERRLRQVEERYEIAMGAINESVYDWDIARGRIFYSESMERAIGLPTGVLKTTQDWWDRIHPEDLARYRTAFIAHFKGDTARFECEYRYRGVNGAWRWCRQHGLALRDARGRAVRMVGSTGDITRLKAREEELVAQKALTQAIVEQIPGAVFMKDREGRFTLANRGWSAMSGIPAERAIGRTVHDLYPAEVATRFAAEDEKLLAQGAGAQPVDAIHEGPRQGQFRIVRKAVLSGADGSVQGLVCTSTDITELKRAESELANQAKFTNDVFDSLPLALSMRDGNGKYLFVNRTWEKNFAAAREEVVGLTVHQRLTKDEADEVLALDRAALERGPGAPLELSEFSLRGRHYLQTRTVMVDSQGAVRGVLAASLDVTEKHQIEQALAQERERLGDQIALTRSLIDENPSAMYLKDRQGRYVTVNDAWLRMVGATRERAIGRNVLELFPETESERYHAEDMRLLSQGEGASEVESLRTGPDGKPQWVIIRKAVLRRADGEVVGLIGANTDITRLKQYEAQLADRAKFITELVDALPVSVALRDTECRFLQVNRAWESFFGLTRQEVLGKRFIELPGWQENPELVQVAEDGERIDREFFARGAGGESVAMEHQRLGRTYLIARQVFADSAGRLTAVLATGIDISERRAMEEALATEQRRLDMVVAAARVGIVDWDGHTRVTYYSPRFREMLGYPPDADTSKWPDYFKVLIHPEDRERITKRWRTFILGKGPGTPREEYYSPEEYRLLRADGNYIWVQASGMAMRDEKGFTTRWIAAITEITERRAQEEALRASVRLREEVERMSRHDLKTPLNSVIAMSRLLREGGRVAQEDAELLGTIERAGYRILNMVNLSLDLFRMETGTYQFHPQAVDLAEVACRVAADLESQAASKSIDVRVRVNGVSAATQEVLVRGDELLCYSMFANLVKNAIEASPPGGTVSISLKKEAEAVVAEVHNPGAVPEGMRGRFFRKYATTGKSAGLGLGAYSAQLMARVQEGELSLESTEAAGTTLSARLKPAAADLARAVESRAQASASGAAGEALPPHKVLVVDDDEFNRLVLRRYLPSPPLSVTFAVNGRAALEAAGRDWPDVVLLDLEMPVMDGYEAAGRLREMERARGLKRCLIVAISSNDEEPVVQRALAAGCDQYVVKPAPRQVLWRILGGTTGEEAAPAAPAVASAADAVIVEEDLKVKLPEFLRSRRELLEQMPPALVAGDRALVKRSAHRLAGSFALYGFAWAAAQCRAIEQNALDGDPHDLEARVAAVRTYLDGVKIAFAPVKSAINSEKL